jgi:hypothetical protein
MEKEKPKLSEIIAKLIGKLNMSPVLVAAVVATCLMGGVSSIFITGKFHNPAEKFASEVIDSATGLDLDGMLPDDCEGETCDLR